MLSPSAEMLLTCALHLANDSASCSGMNTLCISILPSLRDSESNRSSLYFYKFIIKKS